MRKVACRLDNPMLRPRGVGAGDAERPKKALGGAENMGK